MDTIKISKEDLRRFLITYQGLGSESRFEGKSGIKAFFKRVGGVFNMIHLMLLVEMLI